MVRRLQEIFAPALMLVSLLAAVPAFAQGGRSEVSGTIVDAEKAVLPGVTVTATNEGTGLQRTTTTSESGAYIIPSLLPGTYTITADLAGFQTARRTGVTLNVGQEATLNLTLQIAGVSETITVSGQTPLVESTSSRIGTNVTSSEIDGLPSANRSQFSLMQTIPGLVPVLQVGSFEGGQFSANGQATTNNLFLVDGQSDNDSRRGGSQGTQARVSLDSMAEYQVQTHQYGAEYGGSTGVVVNSVTKSGTNKLSGRVFEYFQDNSLQATDYFLKVAGEKNPPSGSNVYGGSIGGPIIANKFFYFFNYEGTNASEAANLSFPAAAAPLAVSYSTTTKYHGPNTFLRLDYHLTGNNQLSFRWTREAVITENDSLEGDLAIRTAARHENDAGDQVFSASWTSVLNNKATNELKVGHVRESLLQGPSSLFDIDPATLKGSWKFTGFGSVDPFDVGSQNTHPDYIAGNRNTYTQDLIRDYNIDDQLTWIAGAHSLKIGAGFSRNTAMPQGTAANFIGLYTFPTDAPFNAADPRTYPFRFGISFGQYEFDQIDKRVGSYISDKWQVSKKLALNIGLRYDWQSVTPKTRDAFGPRFGVAYDLLGDGKTLVRGGIGKVYQFQQLAVLATLEQRAVISPTRAYDTGQVTSPATTGTFPVGSTANDTACLNPVAGRLPGEAVISAACRAFLVTQRNAVLAGGVVNNTTTGPVVDGDRRMAYTWSFSAGVKREIANNLAVSIDYVGNQGRHNTAVIDINEGPVNPATGRVTRLGVSAFDPAGALVPAAARGTSFFQFNQQQTTELGSALNTEFNSLELELEKRFSHRWSGRVSYTYARCYDVGAIIVDSNPRLDYGRCDRDNTHAFASSANFDLGRGFGAGFVFRSYSGYPINETVGTDVNGDGTSNDRPARGVNDLVTLPSGLPGTIVSDVDARGVAVRNGINGEAKTILDGRFQYVHTIGRVQAGLFLEIYNLTNHTNFGNPTGARNSVNFLKTIVADNPRTAQLGFRLIF
ncbi:MAG TPA: TonB-dependent receptor [Vicinamibacterales bacterium]|nr:TonB-dependent receptor [Vicinamibacterales bacterium]